jgi:hypothetical protein
MIRLNENGNGTAGVTHELRIELRLKDPEVVRELEQYTEGRMREEAAAAALRVGILAIRQASGSLDAAVIRTAGEGLITDVKQVLAEQLGVATAQLSTALRDYFDPENGSLPQRLRSLTKGGGELEAVLSRYLDGEQSMIALELEKRIGKDSPLVRRLSPDQADGILASIAQTVGDVLEKQRAAILGEFSLDNEDSALTRLVQKVTDGNGQLRKDLSSDVEKLQKEFSLDNQDGALTRLVGSMEKAQRAISSEFSLDNEGSALSKLSAAIANMAKSNADFQHEVRSTLEKLAVRRAEAARGTAHGHDFEAAAHEVLRLDANGRPEMLDETGTTAGAIPRCKKGDFVTTLTDDSAAPGARIVIEAKEHNSFSVSDAVKELDEARKNRKTDAGVFIYSASCAPVGLEPLSRHGDNIIVVWDANDASTDVFVQAAMSLARAVVIGKRRDQESSSADLSAMDDAINRIVNDAKVLESIATMAETVRSNGEKIREKSKALKDKLDEQIARLGQHLQGIQQAD